MPRPRLHPENGPRRTLCLPADLDEELRVEAARKLVPFPVLIAGLLREALKPGSVSALEAAEFPDDWDGSDLQERLLQLRRRQLDLAQDLQVSSKTLGSWIRGVYCFPKGKLEEIQEVLKQWKPEDKADFQPGPRLSIQADQERRLSLLAAERGVSLPVFINELLEHWQRPPLTPEEDAVMFPENWDGSDLRRRLYYRRMRQTDLARALGIPVNTLNSWLCGENPFDKDRLPEIQEALKAHEPIPIENFRTGSRSPGF